MTEPRKNILPSDVDVQGNVTIWDHGPQEPVKFRGETDEDFAVRQELHKEDAERWNETNPAPVAVLRHRADAAAAIAGDPRYAIEPFELDEGAVEAEVKKIQEARAAALAAPQLAIDRRTAIGRIMGERAAKARAERVKDRPVVEASGRPFMPPRQLPQPPVRLMGETDEDFARRRQAYERETV